jgi:succinyl-CoA synthetase alpha subunit
MGHAGAIISEGSETADAKIKILKKCGVSVAKTVSDAKTNPFSKACVRIGTLTE